MKVRPYFIFNNTLEMLELYKQLGVENVQVVLASDPQFKDMPQAQKPANPDTYVMNASFEILGNRVYCSDKWDAVNVDHSNSSLCMDFNVNQADELAFVKDLFVKAETLGLEITMPLAETEWTPLFGMFKDTAGLTWMVNGVW